MRHPCQKCKRPVNHEVNKWCLSCREKESSKQKKMHANRKLKDGSNYVKRDRNLLKLGYASYRSYLSSDLWANIRFQVFMAKGTVCSLCPNKAVAVHHNRYSLADLKGETLDELHPICRLCHKSIEFKKRGRKKLNLNQAKNKFTQRIAQINHA